MREVEDASFLGISEEGLFSILQGDVKLVLDFVVLYFHRVLRVDCRGELKIFLSEATRRVCT